jgi:PleD family two-component response regulator
MVRGEKDALAELESASRAESRLVKPFSTLFFNPPKLKRNSLKTKITLTLPPMSKPLALVFYSNLLPGSQLANRMQDLGYRVQSVSSPTLLADACERDKPLVVLAELFPQADTCAAVAQMRANPATRHIPVLGFSPTHDAALQARAKEAGVNLVAVSTALAEQLPQLLDQILQVE